jgi:STE24 endopeptidase
MNRSLTAAIVGVVPRLRYIMFTKRLLHELSPNAIESILAHEIGHSYRKHLLIFPLILLGMIVCTSLFAQYFSDPLSQWLSAQNAEWLFPLTIFIGYAIIIALYFRFVFGLFSRLFERQADLHGFVLGLLPEHMIEALDDVAVATGFTHMAPNWHHYSIQQRIDFLKAATENPKLIQAHHRRVKLILFLYFILLAAALLLLV